MEATELNDLARLAVQGDGQALERLVRHVQDWIYNIVRGMALSPADAEDITQEVLIKVTTHLARFDPCALRFHTGQLVAVGHDPDRVGEVRWAIRTKVLHKTETEAHLLDQHRPRAMSRSESDHLALELRIFDASAPNVEKIKRFLEHGPRRADRVVARLERRRRHIPALYDKSISRRIRGCVIAFQPLPLDQVIQRAAVAAGTAQKTPSFRYLP